MDGHQGKKNTDDVRQMTFHLSNGTRMGEASRPQVKNPTGAPVERTPRDREPHASAIESDQQVLLEPWRSVKSVEVAAPLGGCPALRRPKGRGTCNDTRGGPNRRAVFTEQPNRKRS